MLVFRNGKEFLKVSKSSWNTYLNLMSPARIADKSDNCELSNNYIWKNKCSTCNAIIGNFGNSCVNKITSLNLQNHYRILSKDSEKEMKEFYFIEVDRNNNKSTI